MSDPNTRPISVADEVKNSFLDYSMSVIISRALPDVRDGLKPSQRRILYAMHELGLYSPKKHVKCAKIAGDTSGNYHPHGEAVIYPTLVHMGQEWAMRETLIDPQGNFGSVEGDPPAAMRYTEARMTHLGGSLMQDMDKDTVDFVPNYDERLTEPTVFPAAFPNLIVNGGTGIAVGMATNMPPHNLGEVVDAVCAQIDNPAITTAEIMAHIKGPDFPTGCTIMGTNGIRDYMETGHGSVRIRGEASAQVHVLLGRILVLVQSHRRCLPDIDHRACHGLSGPVAHRAAHLQRKARCAGPGDAFAGLAHRGIGAPERAQQGGLRIAIGRPVVEQCDQGGQAQDVGGQHDLVLLVGAGLADRDQEIDRALELRLAQLHVLDKGVQVPGERRHQGAQPFIRRVLHGLQGRRENGLRCRDEGHRGVAFVSARLSRA